MYGDHICVFSWKKNTPVWAVTQPMLVSLGDTPPVTTLVVVSDGGRNLGLHITIPTPALALLTPYTYVGAMKAFEQPITKSTQAILVG